MVPLVVVASANMHLEIVALPRPMQVAMEHPVIVASTDTKRSTALGLDLLIHFLLC
jgi:hypothetical protein